MGLRWRRIQRSPLTSFGVQTGTPRWSPDGGLIAFDSQFGGQSNLYTVDPAGGIPAKLNIDVSGNAQPSWSPDGRWVYFVHGDDIDQLPSGRCHRAVVMRCSLRALQQPCLWRHLTVNISTSSEIRSSGA